MFINILRPILAKCIRIVAELIIGAQAVAQEDKTNAYMLSVCHPYQVVTEGPSDKNTRHSTVANTSTWSSFSVFHYFTLTLGICSVTTGSISFPEEISSL